MTLWAESDADQIDHIADAVVNENVAHVVTLWWRFDVRKFTIVAILFTEIQCTKGDILMF